MITKIETGGRPHNTTVSPDGKRMYLSPMGGPKRVTIVDIAAGHKVIGEIPFEDSVRPPAISGDEKLFFQHIDGLLGFCFPGSIGGGVVGINADDVELVEIPEFDTVQIGELAAEDEMQQLFALALIHH